MEINPVIGAGGSAGSYSVSDQGYSGDRYLVSPKPYPVPGYLREYDSLRRALQVSVDACALQQGPCWVLRAHQVHHRCGQACGGGCPTPGPLSGVGPISRSYPDPVRRSVESAWTPVVRVTAGGGISIVSKKGCVLPIWQRIFYVGDEYNSFTREKPGLTYRAAVAAARKIASDRGVAKLVGARTARDGVVPVVYVHPGGIVRAVPKPRGWETSASKMSDFEVHQQEAASRGASLLPPFGV